MDDESVHTILLRQLSLSFTSDGLCEVVIAEVGLDLSADRVEEGLVVSVEARRSPQIRPICEAATPDCIIDWIAVKLWKVEGINSTCFLLIGRPAAL